jgi:hypothetical protein
MTKKNWLAVLVGATACSAIGLGVLTATKKRRIAYRQNREASSLYLNFRIGFRYHVDCPCCENASIMTNFATIHRNNFAEKMAKVNWLSSSQRETWGTMFNELAEMRDSPKRDSLYREMCNFWWELRLKTKEYLVDISEASVLLGGGVAIVAAVKLYC